MHYLHTLLTILNEMSPFLLLGFLFAGLLHAFVPQQLYARHLAQPTMRSVIKAALLGIPLPLCSCGVLPTAVSLRNNGASTAASTSFLIATPQTGVDSIAATYSLLGLPMAVIRPIAALLTALAGGWLVDTCDKQSDAPVAASPDADTTSPQKLSVVKRIALALRYGLHDMMKSIGKWLVIGLLVAALIIVFLPDNFFLTYAKYPALNMVIVLAVSVPMYVCATGSIPIAMSLMLKGLSPGAALVLLMAGPAANFASVLVISRSFGRKATICYLSAIVSGAMAFGLIIDYLLPHAWFVPAMVSNAMCGHCATHATPTLNALCSVVLAASLLLALGSTIIQSLQIKHHTTMQTRKFKIKGMMCAHCQANVQKALSQLDNVDKVTVDLASGTAYVEGSAADQAIIAQIEKAGYTYVEE